MSLAFDRKLYGKLLAEYQPQVITSEAEYEVMLANAERLIGCKNRSQEETALLQILVRLIEEYENKNYPMNKSSPHIILQHLMEAREIKQSELVEIFGSKEIVSEIIDGKRAITETQTKALGDFFHVSPKLFIS
ncbi:transcriptional regulator [Plectonema cf. radiosum LEGE 06105]|uniref:Transcriptional regulator n=1 Tax=Plectonema cf. radiosum LEGE 06105 TaxID=945769 RepID=A0A8J7JTW5_9CYAN|nr:transcriptional regulator [Plectonema radiosum]MBE9214334.1 transcriptional regulator [Plectonema cf. radiosum LEGE 06105]